MPHQQWPERLIVIRHGESAGNVARDKAEAEELERIDIATRDVDVPLSEAGAAHELLERQEHVGKIVLVP